MKARVVVTAVVFSCQYLGLTMVVGPHGIITLLRLSFGGHDMTSAAPRKPLVTSISSSIGELNMPLLWYSILPSWGLDAVASVGSIWYPCSSVIALLPVSVRSGRA